MSGRAMVAPRQLGAAFGSSLRRLADFAAGGRENAIYTASLLLILLHLIDAVVVHSPASVAERLLYALLAALAVPVGLLAYPAAGAGRRIAQALAFGLPALIVGAGIHAYHTAVLGPQTADFTGLLMLAAGAALVVLAFAKAFRFLRPWPLRLVLLPLAYLMAVYLVLPLSFGVAAANVARIANETTPAEYDLSYEDIEFATADGTLIRGWYVPSRNGAAVIALHGASGNRSKVVAQAAVLARAGYGVLLFDVEGFGDSDGRSNNFGWYGVRDVAAAIDLLETRDDVDAARIGGLGLSMGGEIMLTAAADMPELRAIVVEGASIRTWQDFKDQPGREWLAGPTYFLAVTTAGLLSGAPEPEPLLELVPRISPRPLLLISAEITAEREMNRLFADVAGPGAELWEIPESEHAGALNLHPDEYERRVLAFFDSALSTQ